MDEVRTAVVHFARIASCFERRRDGVVDNKAEQLLRRVSERVLKHRLNVETESSRASAVYMFGDLEAIYRDYQANKRFTGDDLRRQILDYFRCFGVVLKPHHIDRMAPSRKEIGLKGPRHFAEVALGENVLGVYWRTLHNWRLQQPRYAPPIAFEATASVLDVIEYVAIALQPSAPARGRGREREREQLRRVLELVAEMRRAEASECQERRRGRRKFPAADPNA